MRGFEERLLALVAPARYRRRASSPALFAISNGETDFEIDQHPDSYSLSKQDRGAERHELMSSPELEIVQKYLVMQLATDVRAHTRMGRIALSGAESDLTPGFALDSTPTGTTVRWVDQERAHTAVFPPADRARAIQFSYYADAPLEDLERSVADPLGRPVFAGP
jgi:hypothetical protein